LYQKVLVLSVLVLSVLVLGFFFIPGQRVSGFFFIPAQNYQTIQIFNGLGLQPPADSSIIVKAYNVMPDPQNHYFNNILKQHSF
jgi:hypothetical protein